MTQVYFNQKDFAARIGRSTRWLRKMGRIGFLKPKRVSGALFYCDDMLSANFPGTLHAVEERVRKLRLVHEGT